MNKALILILVFVAGLLLGAFFFGGLWWTSKKGIVSKYPTLWFLGSFIIRMGITLVTLYFISRHDWKRFLVCLVGFIIARTIIIRFTKIPEIKKNK